MSPQVLAPLKRLIAADRMYHTKQYQNLPVHRDDRG